MEGKRNHDWETGFTVLRVAEAMLAVIVMLFLVMVVSTAIKAGSAAKSAKYDASCIEALQNGKDEC